MMRSLYSGVTGLKAHQTRMDVIGNNIANVNTVAYKSQSMTFGDLLYQTTQSATGANEATGKGGTNARQIGLGVKTGAISTNISAQGAAQTTNNAFDIMITGESFFIVSNGVENFFTRDGSFTVDSAGNLIMASTGYTVMGWQVNPETGEVLADTVSALRVMSAENLTYPPEATSKAYVSGIVDAYDTALGSAAGRIFTLSFYDQKGYLYTAKFSVHSTTENDVYTVSLDDIWDSDGVSLVTKYNLTDISQIATFGTSQVTSTTSLYSAMTGVTAVADGDDFLYYQTMSASDVLSGFSSDTMITLSSGNWAIDSSSTTEWAEGDEVTVTGTVTLSQSDLCALQGPNLVPNTADDGSIYYTYSYTDSNGDLQEGTLDATSSAADWEAALSVLNVTDVSNVTVDEDGNVTLEFAKTFEATTDISYETSTTFKASITQMEAFGLSDGDGTTYSFQNVSDDGLTAQITKTDTITGNQLVFDSTTGSFDYIGAVNNDTVTMTFSNSATSLTGGVVDLSFFSDVDIDFSLTTGYNNGGTSTIGATSGDLDGLGTGRAVGEMTGVSIGQDGLITASYDNGQTKILGQIAVASFANASGLAKTGDNLYSTTQNSGDFDGIGSDITANGEYMTSGVLEMSNVDLASEFTDMIITQRGFQANSRIITVSDTMLEELVNLKR